MLRSIVCLLRAIAFACGAVLGFSVSAHAQTREPIPDIRPPRIVLESPAQIPVRLDGVRIDTEMHGSQALTRIEMTFFNPNRRILEGELQFPLFAGQTVVGLAMDVDGKLRDAVPVDKARGQEIFEEVTRQRVDPALLEVTQGNQFKLRVYPIPAKGAKRVVLQVLETLPVREGNLVFRLPVAYAQKLPKFDLSVKVFGAEQEPVAQAENLGQVIFARKGEIYETQVSGSDLTGGGVLEVRVPAPRRASAAIQTFGGKTYFRAEIPQPAVKAVPRALPARVALYWDASGSGAHRDRAREFAVLDQYFRAMRQGEVTLVRFRDSAEAPQVFRIVNGRWKELKAALNAIAYDGATRFGGLPRIAGAGEALLVSDGIANFGGDPFPALDMPVFALSSSVSADVGALRSIAERSGGRLVDLQRLAETEAVERLTGKPAEMMEPEGEGVSDLVTESRFAQDGRFLVSGVLDAAVGKLRVAIRLPDGTTTSTEVPLQGVRHAGRAGQSRASLASLTWARLKLDELDGEYALKRGEIRRIGKKFRLPTRETSLIVLDRAEDYARYDIEPPEELAGEVERLRADGRLQRETEQRNHMETVVKAFRQKKAWWNTEFPKGNRPRPKEDLKLEDEVAAHGETSMPVPLAAPSPASSARRSAESAARFAAESSDGAMAKSAGGGDGGEAPAAAITLKKWRSDAPYIGRFQEASPDSLYSVYLDERPSWDNSSAFYLDAADMLFDKGRPALAIRALSNLAEMNLESRDLLRILGYRLLQAKQPKLAIPVLEKVRELAPHEPQSYRDLGLAYAADRQFQKAADALWEVVSRRWPDRFPNIELIALAELNALIATAPEKIDVTRYDPRLIVNLPVDLRVVMSWDADSTDIDLWVTDPNGEKSFYGSPLSYQGGRMSNDFTGGYGPEEFSLKAAKPGKYLIQANFYGHQQQVVAGATTLQLRLQTAFGTANQKEEIITLRLKGKSEIVTVGEFTVGNPGRKK